jgi:hypothetical protein
MRYSPHSLPSTYAEWDAFLGDKAERPAAHNTTVRRIPAGPDSAVPRIVVRYHSTDVATFHPNGDVTVDTGGWSTVTTFARLNALLGVRGSVGTARRVPYLYPGTGPERWDRKVPLREGMRVSEHGTIVADGYQDANLSALRRNVSMRDIAP